MLKSFLLYLIFSSPFGVKSDGVWLRAGAPKPTPRPYVFPSSTPAPTTTTTTTTQSGGTTTTSDDPAAVPTTTQSSTPGNTMGCLMLRALGDWLGWEFKKYIQMGFLPDGYRYDIKELEPLMSCLMWKYDCYLLPTEVDILHKCINQFSRFSCTSSKQTTAKMYRVIRHFNISSESS